MHGRRRQPWSAGWFHESADQFSRRGAPLRILGHDPAARIDLALQTKNVVERLGDEFAAAQAQAAGQAVELATIGVGDRGVDAHGPSIPQKSRSHAGPPLVDAPGVVTPVGAPQGNVDTAASNAPSLKAPKSKSAWNMAQRSDSSAASMHAWCSAASASRCTTVLACGR